MDVLRYPIGPFELPSAITDADVAGWIEDIASLAERLRAALKDRSAEWLERAYRPDGWTVRQVVHHIADSQLNGYIRMRMALTEDRPTIKLYAEGPWAELADQAVDIDASVRLVEALNERWVHLMRNLSESERARPLNNPEVGEQTVGQLIALYAWHGNHHLAHIWLAD